MTVNQKVLEEIKLSSRHSELPSKLERISRLMTTVTNERGEIYNGCMVGMGLFLTTAKAVDY